jgi:hypothetical protein
MSHIFISYSHKDKKYVEKLEKHLIEEGFNVWIDHRIDYGSQWTETIENAIDACDAYIVIMSNDSKKSPWVQREVIHAEKRRKPFFPLLLNGEAWFSLGNIQYVDVTDRLLPPEKFYKRLEKVTPRKKIIAVVPPTSVSSAQSKQRLKLPKQFVVSKISFRILGIVAILVVAAFGSPRLVKLMGQIQFSTRIPTSTNKSILTVTETPKLSTATLTPTTSATLKPTNTPPLTKTPTPLPSEITDSKGVNMVYVDGFYIDQYEVTNILYKECFQAGVCSSPSRTDSWTHPDYFFDKEFNEYPVIWVGFDKAKTYCEDWRGGRLPTEQEWEKAASGVDGFSYPYKELSCDYANHKLCKSDTTAVGSYENSKSVYGIYDLLGNVAEWVDSEREGTARGGSWSGGGGFVSNAGKEIGFRCALSATP